MKEYQTLNKEKRRDYKKEYYKKNSTIILEKQKERRKLAQIEKRREKSASKYGLSYEWWVETFENKMKVVRFVDL